MPAIKNKPYVPANFRFCESCDKHVEQTGEFCHTCSQPLAKSQTIRYPKWPAILVRCFARHDGLHYNVEQSGRTVKTFQRSNQEAVRKWLVQFHKPQIHDI